MTGPQITIVAIAGLLALCKAYNTGKREGMAAVIRIVRDDLQNGPALVSSRALIDQLNDGLKKMGAKP